MSKELFVWLVFAPWKSRREVDEKNRLTKGLEG